MSDNIINMNNKIKVEMHCHDNFVCGRVLEMPECLRGSNTIIAGDVAIESQTYPELTSNILLLRGSNIFEDNKWFSYQYESEEQARSAIESYQNLIHIYNNKHLT